MIKSKIDKVTSFEKRFEKINTVIFESSEVASKKTVCRTSSPAQGGRS